MSVCASAAAGLGKSCGSPVWFAGVRAPGTAGGEVGIWVLGCNLHSSTNTATTLALPARASDLIHTGATYTEMYALTLPPCLPGLKQI